MEFFEVINNRKTIRKYKADALPVEDIKKIADAARLAPSATNTQNWKFIAVTDEKVKNELVNAVDKKFRQLIEFVKHDEEKERVKRSRNYSVFFKNAPVVFVIVETAYESSMLKIMANNGLTGKELQKYDNQSYILSMGAAIENMSLAATALGYGTCWMCAPLVARDEMKAVLKLDETDRIVTILALGKPDDNTPPQPPKKTIDEVFSII